MAKYREQFNLSIADIDVIESALREQIAQQAAVKPGDVEFDTARRHTRSMNEVLGRLHNQKIFYAQVNDTGTPVA